MDSAGSDEDVPPPPEPPGSLGDSPAAGSARTPRSAESSPRGVATARKPVCRYGKACYQKNPAHFEEFAHPWLDEKKDERPVCRYGRKCYQKNPSHLAQYAHPWLDEKEASSGVRASSGSPGRVSPASSREVLRRLSTPPRANDMQMGGASQGGRPPGTAPRAGSPPPARASSPPPAADALAEKGAAASKLSAGVLPGSSAASSSAEVATSKADGDFYSSLPVPKGDVISGAADKKDEDLQSLTKAVDDLEAQRGAACEAPEAAPAADLAATSPPAPRAPPTSVPAAGASAAGASTAAASTAAASTAAASPTKDVSTAPAAADLPESDTWVQPRSSGSKQRSPVQHALEFAAAAAFGKSLPRKTLQVSVLGIWLVDIVLGVVILVKLDAS